MWSFKEDCDGDVNRVKMLQERERAHSGKARDGPRPGNELAKGPREGARMKVSQYCYNQARTKITF